MEWVGKNVVIYQRPGQGQVGLQDPHMVRFCSMEKEMELNLCGYYLCEVEISC